MIFPSMPRFNITYIQIQPFHFQDFEISHFRSFYYIESLKKTRWQIPSYFVKELGHLIGNWYSYKTLQIELSYAKIQYYMVGVIH